MRVTISHNKPVAEVKASVDRSFDQMFTTMGSGLVEFSDEHRQWHGNTMVFSLTAKMGFIRTPIKGTIDVTEKEVAVDVDLGLLGKIIPEQSVRSGIEGKVRGLLT